MTHYARRAETLKVTTADGAFDVYLSHPAESADPAPAVIVFQEIFGVNAYVRGVCDWLASEGYLAAAPDLFWRQERNVQLSESDREQATALMKGLDAAAAIRDGADLLSTLRARADCTGKVGVMGYCLGGKLSYLMASDGAIDAAVSYYGVGIHDALDRASALACPILLHIAREDVLCPPAAQQRIDLALAGNRLVEIHRYAAGHAFARSGSPAFVEECASSANARTLSFLATHLASPLRQLPQHGATR